MEPLEQLDEIDALLVARRPVDIIVKRVSPEMLDALEALRARRGLRSRAELIRVLLAEAVR